MSTVLHQELSTSTAGFLPVNGVDYIEFFVGNARQASYFYRMAMGMRLAAYAGPETGQRDRTSFVLEQGDIRFVLTTPLRPDNEIAAHIHRHGDGVRDVALWVDDARQAWKEATRRGARSVREPERLEDAGGTVRLAAVATYGDTIHTFIERRGYSGPFLPGYRSVPDDPLSRPAGLERLDRLAGSVPRGESDRWTRFYRDALDFDLHEELKAGPAASSVSMCKATAARGRLEMSICEPPARQGASEIESYLQYYHGSGVHRIALMTSDILYTVATLRERGVEMLQPPPACYRGMEEQIGRIDEPFVDLERLGVSAARYPGGYTLSCQTRPVEDRPTLTFEIVQHKARSAAAGARKGWSGSALASASASAQ